MANVRQKTRSDTTPEKKSEKASNERYRELKKRYLRVCRENARLRKAIAVYESWTEDENEEAVNIAIQQAADMLSPDTCTSCGDGQYQELDLGHLLIKTCDKCGYRVREKQSLIRET